MTRSLSVIITGRTLFNGFDRERKSERLHELAPGTDVVRRLRHRRGRTGDRARIVGQVQKAMPDHGAANLVAQERRHGRGRRG